MAKEVNKIGLLGAGRENRNMAKYWRRLEQGCCLQAVFVWKKRVQVSAEIVLCASGAFSF